MELKLEELNYQKSAIKSVVDIFTGQQKNTFDNSTTIDGIRSNFLSITSEKTKENLLDVMKENAIPKELACLSEDNDYCIEMETGTGKTLVYIRTIYELYRKYGFAKYIILVPSVAIKQGIIDSYNNFEKQLYANYGFKLNLFEYDSSRLSRVVKFVEEQTPQVMVMTLQSFNSDDKILNQQEREDLFSNMPYIEAIGKTNPIVIMDEPQEGMDTENSVERIKSLQPLCKLRYSATHKVMKNLVYRLTPYESYKEGLVKKIEVLTVAERNDEATLKIEVSQVRTFTNGKPPEVKLRAWRHSNARKAFEFKETPWMKENSDLYENSKNVSYKGFIINRISKSLRDKKFKVEFANGVTLIEKEQAKDFEGIFRQQLYWLIDTHFSKKEKLMSKGIKVLSLVFLDKVDSYMGDNPIVKKIFEEEYIRVYSERYSGESPTTEHIEGIQGYYFAKTKAGSFTDSEASMKKNKEIFDSILKDKKALLSFDNPIEFIFTHSALGVGWDNPNVFNIATLNHSYSEIKKRQEIGRGLRICVNQQGQRVYDDAEVEEGSEINLLTVVPNETYESFVSQYQEQIQEAYGSTKDSAETRHNHKGTNKTEKIIKRNNKHFESAAFKDFWESLSLKTDYTVFLDEEQIIAKSIEALNSIHIPEYEAVIALNRIKEIHETDIEYEFLGDETAKLKAYFAPMDLIKELSENTSVSLRAATRIFTGIENNKEILKNPPRFMQEAYSKIKNIEFEEMLRTIEYRAGSKTFGFDKFKNEVVRNTTKIKHTPNRGLYDHIVWDSEIERDFAGKLDQESEVVCFLKLPNFYKIPTPIGDYNPDFGVVLKRKKLRADNEEEFYFVVETKGTNDIDDKSALTENEIYKIKCAIKHFAAIGIRAEANINYLAPIKDYEKFKEEYGKVTK